MKEKIVLCWSGGKDSALALHRLRQDDRFDVVGLLTTCNEHFQRVSMHGVRLDLLDRQAEAVGLPVQRVFMSQICSNEEYRTKMGAALREYQQRGVTACAFGDIFLADLKAWREAQLAALGLRALFPLWQVDTRGLMGEFFRLRFQSVICCANDAWFDDAAVGRNIDEDFVRDLPVGVDPCGENGEYHSFAFAGPIFRYPVKFSVGEKVYRPIEQTITTTQAVPPATGARATRGFWFCDLLAG